MNTLLLVTELSQTMLGSTITALAIDQPFDYAPTAATVAAVAGGVLALTFGWMVGFRLIKKVIMRLSGSA